MEPIVMVLVFAVIGGSLLALLMLWEPVRARRPDEAPDSATPLGADVINMAHIKVDGVGGLGLVVMAFGIAVAIPQIGEAVGLGLALGTALAAMWIARRRHFGPMPSSGRHGGAHELLPSEPRDQRSTPQPDNRTLELAATP